MTDFKPKLGGGISLGNIITIFTGVIAIAAAWGSIQENIRALAQRVDKGELRDEETSRAITSMSGAIIELRTDQKAMRSETERQGRQLDRIEQLLQSQQRKPQ